MLEATLGAASRGIGFPPDDALKLSQRLAGFEDVRDLPNIARGLVKRGYDDEAIRYILGENALRVFENVCGCESRASPLLRKSYREGKKAGALSWLR